MNVTPLIPGTENAPRIANAQTANSSPADFLFADSPANSGQDFKTIAAALLGTGKSAPSPTPSLTKPPDKRLIAQKKPANGLPQDETESRKSNQASDSNSTPAYPALTAPLVDVPKSSLEVAPKLETKDATPGLQNINPSFGSSATLPKQTKSAGDHSLATEVSGMRPSEITETVTPRPVFIEATMQGETAVQSEAGIDLPSVTGTSAALLESAEDAPGVKPASKPAEQSSTHATAVKASTSPGDARLGANPAQPLPLATNSLTSATVLETISVASARQILDGSMAAQAALQSGSTKPGSPTDSKSVTGRATPGGTSKIKDRGKDPHIEKPDSAKFGQVETSSTESGFTKPIATSSKDIAVSASTTHSDAHAKSLPLKPFTGTPSSQTAVADADGPDEALPTAASSPLTAKFVQGMSQSEFRVGMQTQEFGNIDIRTSVARHMFSAQISVEHGDMAKSMTADLPALYHKLADQQVTVGSIVIQGQNLATSSGLAHDAQPQPWHKPQVQSGTSPETKTIVPLTTEVVESAGRLDIRI